MINEQSIELKSIKPFPFIHERRYILNMIGRPIREKSIYLFP